jgi:CBS domain-containing protein
MRRPRGRRGAWRPGRTGITIEPAASLVDAARIMDSEKVGMLPVIADGRGLGVITDRDIVVRAISRGADPTATTVRECLTPHVRLTREDWTTDDAMKTMGEAQIGRLPVASAKAIAWSAS